MIHRKPCSRVRSQGHSARGMIQPTEESISEAVGRRIDARLMELRRRYENNEPLFLPNESYELPE